MIWYVRQKITIELLYALMDCCHIYTHDDLSIICSMNMKGKLVETLLHMMPLL